MRIACLQFAPQVGDVNNNLTRADAVLCKANPEDLDLLVLPELAFSGYNFQSLQHISPFLEPTEAGISSLWARTTALKYGCIVTVGYPEKVDVSGKWPSGPEYYNSAITVGPEGETIAHTRKSFLYYTDETWALEGPEGFYAGYLEGLGNVAMGICMDINPYKFEAPWTAWEFAYHVLHREANLVVLSMAWLTREDPRAYSRTPREPDMETLSYWMGRLEPIIRDETKGEIVVVIANRCGIEGDAVYAGTSVVLGIHDGEVKVYGILGRGEKELLVIDTTRDPQAKLVSAPTSATSTTSRPETQHDITETTPAHKSPGLSDNRFEENEPWSPISPTDRSSPLTQFFSEELKSSGDNNESLLISSIERLESTPSPQLISFDEPASETTNNAGRTPSPEEENDPSTSNKVFIQENSTVFKDSTAERSPPHSASAAMTINQASRTNTLRPKSWQAPARPKSTIW